MSTIVIGLQFAPISQIQRQTKIAADDLSQRGDIRQAIIQLNTLLRFEPWSVQDRIERAHDHLIIGDNQAAIGDLLSLSESREISGEEVLLLAAMRLQNGNPDAAVSELRAAIDTHRLSAENAAAALSSATRHQDWWTATAALLTQNMLVPGQADTLKQLTIVEALDQPQMALKTAQDAVALDPTAQDYLKDLIASLSDDAAQPADKRYARLGAIYAGLGKFEIAETALTRAVNVNPAYGEALGYLAYVRARQGKPALGILNQAIRLTPQSATTYFLAGLTWKSEGRTLEARSALERAYDLDPSNPSTAVEIASTHRAETASAYAEVWMLEAVRLSGGDLKFRILLAQFYVDDNFKVADAGLPLAQQLVIDAPDNAEAHDALGWAYFLLGGLDRAAEQLNRAVTLDPMLARVHTHLGALYEAQGNSFAAIAAYNRASDLDPSGPFGALARRALARLNP